MTRSVVLLDSDLGDSAIERSIVEAADFQFIDARGLPPEATAAQISGASALLTQYQPITADVLASCPALEVVIAYGVGTDMIDVEAARARGIDVRGVVDYCVDEVADHTMALMLAAIRRIVPLDRAVHAGGWPTTPHLGCVGTLAGRRCAIVGYGSIGQAVARRVTSFGATVLVHDPYVDEADICSHGFEPVALTQAFQCEVVSLHLPLTEQTRGLVDASLLDRLPFGALLVNVARGGIIDETALRLALDHGAISAALDVLCEEPPAPGDPVLNAPNTLITPHMAWFSPRSLDDLRSRVAREAVLALRAHNDR